MGSFVTSCFLGTMCRCLCAGFSKCGTPPKLFARIGYVLFAFIWIVISTLLLYFGHHLFSLLPFSKYLVCANADDMGACVGVSAVYRTSFTLVLFHLLLCLLCSCRNKVVAIVNEGAWPAKFVFVLLVFIGSLFIDNNFFHVYGYIAMVGSSIFVIYEMILIIDMAYSWNSAWVSNFDEGQTGTSNCCWTVMLILGTAVGVGGGLTIYILLMLDYAAKASVFDWIVLILPVISAIAYFLITILQVVQGGSIFTCALFFLFEAFITASAIFSRPEIITETNMLLEILIGLGFLFFVLFYVGLKTEKEQPTGIEETKENEAASLPEKATNAVAEKAEKDENKEVFTSDDKKEEEVPQLSEKAVMFHLFMAFASLYYSMVLSNWGSPKVNGHNAPSGFSSEWLAYGAIVAAQWIGIAFFIWSLIAARVCTDRNFSA